MTHPSELRLDFDTILSKSDAEQRKANVESNDKFVALMARAVIKGKEKVTPGTFVDHSPMAPAARRYANAELRHSPVGSPAAWCMGS